MLMIVQAPKEPRDTEPRWKRQAPEILPTEHVPIIVTMRTPTRGRSDARAQGKADATSDPVAYRIVDPAVASVPQFGATGG